MISRLWTWTVAGMFVAGVVAAGCNGSSLSNVDGGGADRPSGNLGDGAAAVDAKVSDGASFEAGAADLPPPAPPNPESARVVPGRARLVGTHQSACSNQVPATGDRWCAFSLPNQTIGYTDLWVINETKAAAGVPIKCDGTDPNCKLMVPPGTDPTIGTKGTVLWTTAPSSGPSFPSVHRFDGDTLLFNARAKMDPAVPYSGPIYAWRPGWPEPKQVSQGATAYSCSAHSRTDVVVCLENVSDPKTPPLQFDLTAGRAGTGAKLVKRITPFRVDNDAEQWAAGFTDDGATLLFSTGGTAATDKETLYQVAIDQVGMPDAVKMLTTPGVSQWTLSGDSKHIYFFRDYNYNTMGDPAGTLVAADFPSGANEKVLVQKVGLFQALGDGTKDQGITFFDNIKTGTADYKYMRDPAKPTEVITVATGIAGTISLSRDLRYVMFFRTSDEMTGLTDVWIAKMDASKPACALTGDPGASVYGPAFTPNGSLVMWVDNIDVAQGLGEGWVATPEGCAAKRKFADLIDYWFLHGNDGMVYSDEGGVDTATLKAATFPNGTSLGAGTVIQRGINRMYGLLPEFDSVIYNVPRTPGPLDGLYSFGKLPFGTKPGDGGAGSTDTAPAPAVDASAATD